MSSIAAALGAGGSPFGGGLLCLVDRRHRRGHRPVDGLRKGRRARLEGDHPVLQPLHSLQDHGASRLVGDPGDHPDHQPGVDRLQPSHLARPRQGLRQGRRLRRRPVAAGVHLLPDPRLRGRHVCAPAGTTCVRHAVSAPTAAVRSGGRSARRSARRAGRAAVGSGRYAAAMVRTAGATGGSPRSPSRSSSRFRAATAATATGGAPRSAACGRRASCCAPGCRAASRAAVPSRAAEARRVIATG